MGRTVKLLKLLKRVINVSASPISKASSRESATSGLKGSTAIESTRVGRETVHWRARIPPAIKTASAARTSVKRAGGPRKRLMKSETLDVARAAPTIIAAVL